MRTMKADIINGNEPLSKALDAISRTGTAVMVTKNGKYYGLIDDRVIRPNISDSSRTKAISAAVRAPRLTEDMSLEECMRAFMAGHFKSLPIIEKGKIIGAISRADVMNEMVRMGNVPKTSVSALMASPIYTVDEKETMGMARGLMRKLGVHHLAVTRRGRVCGSLSPFDFSMLSLKPKGRQRFALTSEIDNPDEKKVVEYLREKLVTVRASEPLESAARKMARRNVSKLVVLEGGKAVGVLTAIDVMKFMLSLIEEGPTVFISGLPEDDMFYYGDIEESMKSTLKKFMRSFELGDVNIHFKKGKSTYQMSSKLDVEHSNLVVHSEGYDLKTVVNENLDEIKRILKKRKDYKRDKRKHYMTEGFYGGRTESFYERTG
ncbi:CBS domain-containing protein [Candidatus Micrarchaeota archaeon]|nr:CBS domain-containing protein [Candidatus Micrarchaeota archaeon]MBD3417503.1 CBS domain-containing protein [Candidatus Micrarchaeota archaeon]